MASVFPPNSRQIPSTSGSSGHVLRSSYGVYRYLQVTGRQVWVFTWDLWVARAPRLSSQFMSCLSQGPSLVSKSRMDYPCPVLPPGSPTRVRSPRVPQVNRVTRHPLLLYYYYGLHVYRLDRSHCHVFQCSLFLDYLECIEHCSIASRL